MRVSNVKTKNKVLLMGGMGNKFFQVARALEFKKRGISVELVYFGKYSRCIHRLTGQTKLENWLPVGLLMDALALNYRPISLLELFCLSIKFVFRKINIKTEFDESLDHVINSQVGKEKWDVGYFQSSKHVSLGSVNAIADKLIMILGLGNKKRSNNIGFHLRAGDFSVASRLTKKNIRDALEQIEVDDLQIFIATNDSNFANGIFDGLNVNFQISNLSARNDFIFLATVHSLVLSNSSFAFWAGLCSKRAHGTKLYSLETWPYGDFLAPVHFSVNQRQ